MATFSIMADVPNPVADKNGDPFSGAVLKAFLPGTTTSTSIAIDSAGGSPQASITANAQGKWEVSGNEILPYIDRKHKWGIFANATDAAANTPFYMGPFDNVERTLDTSTTDIDSGNIVYNQGDINAVDRTIESRLQEKATGEDFGALGDGITDDTVKLQAAFDGAKHVDLGDSSKVYLITSGLTASNIEITGRGATIKTSASITSLTLGSNSKLRGIKFTGVGNSVVDSLSRAVEFSGTSNDPAAPTNTENIDIQDCVLDGFGFYGFRGQFVKNVKIINNTIKSIGYFGVLLESPEDFEVNDNRIDDINPGFTANAFGISLTRTENDSVTAFPLPVHGEVSGNRISNVTIWEAIDTHGGQFINISDNVIWACRNGISAVPSDDSSNDPFKAPNNVTITDNVIDLTGLNQLPAIRVAGAAGTLGSPVEAASGCSINDNTIKGGGLEASNNSGGIRVNNTVGVIINGNNLTKPFSSGINFDSDNNGFRCSDNTIIDVLDSTLTDCTGIRINSQFNTGLVTNNNILRVDTGAATNVSAVGIKARQSANNDVKVEDGLNQAVIKTDTTNIIVKNSNPVRQQSGSDVANTTTGVSSVSVAVTFPKPFEAAPKVYVSADKAFIGSVIPIARAISRTTTGFTIFYATPDISNFAAAQAVDIDWRAEEV